MANRNNGNTPHLSLIERLHKISSYVQDAGFSRLDKTENRRLEKLSPRQSHAIGFIYRYFQTWGQGIPMRTLAHALHMSPSAASHMVDCLEEMEMVTRNASPNDHRSILVTIHRKRLPYAAAIEQGMTDALLELQQGLPDEHKQLFTKIIEEMYDIAVSKD